MKKRAYINAAKAICPDGVKGEDGMLHAVEPDYKDIITNANLRRRMSPIVKMGVACGLLCIKENGSKPIAAIITATGLGCLADTEKFLSSIIENDELLLNPTAFTQSTFNVIGAQIALLTNNHAYNNTYVHRGLSFESALIDAMMRVNEGDKNVLLGAVDETTETLHAIMQRMGLLRGVTMGEGAQFFILSDESKTPNGVEIKGVKTYSGKKAPDEVKQYIETLLGNANINASAINCLITGENGNTSQDKVYNEVGLLFPKAVRKTFKDSCGEYPTASSYAFYLGFDYLSENTNAQNVLIYSCYNRINHSIILLGR